MNRILKKTMYSIAALSFIAFPQNALAQEPMELLGTGSSMNTHPVIANGHFKIYERITELSDGKLTFKYLNPNTICPENEVVSSVIKGVLSFGQMSISKTPNKFPLSLVVELPFLFQSSRAASASFYKLGTTVPEFMKEFSDAKLIIGGTSAPQDLLMLKPTKSLKELKGKKIGVAGAGGVDFVKAIGAIPVVMGLTDMYLSLQRGMVDGIFAPIPAYRSYKWPEVAKHLLKVSAAPLASTSVVNNNVYNSMTTDQKKAYDALYGSLAATMAISTVVDKFAKQDLDYIVKNDNVQVYTISPEEMKEWEAVCAPIYVAWKKKVAKLGYDPEVIFEQVKKVADYYNNLDNFNAEYDAYKEILGSAYTHHDY